MNRDLFLAILSMDSYNRGYGEGITGLSESGRLGTAIIREPGEDEQEGWQAAGFYAIAYDMTGVAGFADGERVISYRGTDRIFNNPFGDEGSEPLCPQNRIGAIRYPQSLFLIPPFYPHFTPTWGVEYGG
jgi:hypothetical protein